MTITLFKTLFDNKPYYSTVQAVLRNIKEGPKQLDLIKQIRATTDKEARGELKKQLGVICFGGKFASRKASDLKEYSKIIVLDFDNVDIILKKNELIMLPYIHAVFVSPGGDGLKALVKVSSDNHLGHYKALSKEIKDVDVSGKDTSRACFVSYDPDMYVNEHADIYTKLIEEAYTDQQKIDKLKKWLDNKGEKFISGNRNNFLAKLAGAANRYGINKDFALNSFISDYARESDFSKREVEQVVGSMYRNIANFGVSSFDEAYSEKQVSEILDGQVTTHDVIYLRDVEEDMIKDYNEGTKGAPTTHFPSVDVIFRPQPGDLNVLSGHAGAGKTNWKKQMDLVSSVIDGRKHAWFASEEFPPQFFYKELVRSYIGKPLEEKAQNRMTLEEYKRGMEFVQEHFIFVYPPESPTPDYILERFAEVIIKHGVNSVTIDPFNLLNHVMAKRDDIYLAETLTKFERFAQTHRIYFTVVAHPNKTQKDASGTYTVPDVYDLNGGAVWAARATNIVVYHRPNFGVDKSDPTCELHSKKIKRQMISGIPGVAQIDYNRKTGRYYDSGYNPLTELFL